MSGNPCFKAVLEVNRLDTFVSRILPSINSRSSRQELFKLFLIVCFVISLPILGFTAEPILVDKSLTTLQIGRQVDVLLDPSDKLTISDITSPNYSAAFKPHKTQGFNFGLSGQVIWIRFRINVVPARSGLKGLILAVSKPYFPFVDLYLPSTQGSQEPYELIRSSYLGRTKDKTWKYRHPVFNLPPKIPDNSYLYLRIDPHIASEHASANFTITLADEDAFRRRTWLEISLYSLVFGVFISTILYNFFLSLYLRDKAYYHYVISMTFLLAHLFLRSGFNILAGWPSLTHGLLYSLALSCIFFFTFSQAFLATPKYCPVINKIIWTIIFAAVVVILALWAGYPKTANTLMHLISLLGILSAIFAGLLRLLQGFSPAGYYLAALFSFFACVAIVSLIGFGVLPKNFITINALGLGGTLQAVFLSTALGARIRALRRERKALLKKERLLSDIIEFLPDPTWVIDIEGRVIAWNRAMEQITNIDKKGIIGKGDYEYAVPFYGKPRPMLIDLVLKRNEAIEKEYLDLVTKDGLLFVGESFHPSMGDGGLYLFGTASELNDSQGRAVGAIETIRDITDAKRTEKVRESIIAELQDALNKVRTLSGLLPICASCKKIRDDKGYWNQIESYIHKHSDAQFSHGICPDCAKRLYPDLDL
jgi:PAS domain S-box-containing protein